MARRFSGNKLKQFICRTMDRIPVMAVAIMALIEISSVCLAVKKEKSAKAGAKQALKLTTNIVSTYTGAGIVGAALSMLGPVGSLIGIGLGSLLGMKTAKQINAQIDKI